MAGPIVSDDLWEAIEPLIPEVARRFRHPGRKRIDDRKVLTGILFVLQTGIPWEHLPQEMGCGSGMTWRRRLKEWNDEGIWEQLHEVLLARLHHATIDVLGHLRLPRHLVRCVSRRHGALLVVDDPGPPRPEAESQPPCRILKPAATRSMVKPHPSKSGRIRYGRRRPDGGYASPVTSRRELAFCAAPTM
jgi:transposase